VKSRTKTLDPVVQMGDLKSVIHFNNKFLTMYISRAHFNLARSRLAETSML